MRRLLRRIKYAQYSVYLKGGIVTFTGWLGIFKYILTKLFIKDLRHFSVITETFPKTNCQCIYHKHKEK